MYIKTDQKNYKNTPRRYGLELEFAGIPLPQVAEIVAAAIGGEIHHNHTTHITIKTEKYGDFIVELDVELAQRISQKAHEQKELDPNTLSIESLADMVLPGVLSHVAPTELVTPPLTLDQMEIVDRIVEALRHSGVEGTSKSVIYAFGYHVNPEVKSLETEHIRDVLRAYVLLYDWLALVCEMDLSRKISGYAAPYEKGYAEHILNVDYHPSQEQLIRDYLTFNPSRNYALDMTPLFRFINENLTDTLIKDRLIKSRPTWHFRMPNCKIDEPDWNIHSALDNWHTIEKIAEKPNLIEKIMIEHPPRKPEFLSSVNRKRGVELDRFLTLNLDT